MKKIITRRNFSVFILLFDLIIIYLSIFISYLIFKNSLIDVTDNISAIIATSPYIGLFYLITAHIFELNKPKEFSLFGVSYPIIISILCLFIFTMAMSFFIRKMAYPRSILITSSAIQIILLTIWHLFINKKYLKENIRKTVLVVGYNKAKYLARKLLNTSGMWSNIKQICTPESENLSTYILAYDMIFLADDVEESTKQRIAEFCITENKDFYYEPKYQEIFLFNSNFVRIDDAPLLKTRPLDIDTVSLITKRIIDVSLSLIASIIFAIPALIISITLKLGGGSIIYKQERVTKGNKIFSIYKFRTMIENAEGKSGPVLAQNTDNRITKLGHFLRATRLDEIPQLYNILCGDMSIVGPRPERPFFVEQFQNEIPEYNLRHKVKAGLTGLAQIEGKYNTVVYDKLKYDLLYLNSFSIALDIKLIFQTLIILLKKSSTEGVKDTSYFNNLIEQITEKEK